MLKILFASAAGVIFVACANHLPPVDNFLIFGLILACSNLMLRRFFGSTGRVAGLLHNACLMGLVFALAAAVTAWRGGQYLDTREQLKQLPYWLVEVSEPSLASYGKLRTRLMLICPVVSPEPPLPKSCDDSQLLVARPEVLATYDPDAFAGMAMLGQPGARLILELELRDRSWPGNPGFDKPAWEISQNIPGSVNLVEQTPVFLGVNRGAAYWRHRLRRGLEFPSLVETSAFSGLALSPIIQALTLGDRSELTREHWALFRETGTSHLMAISGMHLGIVSGWVYWCSLMLFRRLVFFRNRYYPQWPAGLMAVATGLIYSLLAGLSLPTQRAFLMLLFAVLGSFSTRPKMVWNGLVIALLLILFRQPFAVLSAGLWLSFAAVAVVFISTGQRITGVASKPASFRSLVMLQGTIFLFMLPFSLYFFQGVSLNSLVANLFAIPLVTLLLLPLCLVLMLWLMITGSASAGLGEWAYWLVDVLFCSLQWMNQQAPYYLALRLSLMESLLLIACALLVVLPFGRMVRCLCALGFLVLLAKMVPQSDAALVLLNHQTPLAVLRQGNESLLIDASPGISNNEGQLLEALDPNRVPSAVDTAYSDLWYGQPWQGYRGMARGVTVANGVTMAKGVAMAKGELAEELLPLSLCYLSRGQQDYLANAFSLTDWVAYHFPDEGDKDNTAPQASCAFSFQWQGHRWLWLEQLSRNQQYQLIHNRHFAAQSFDYVLAAAPPGNGESFSGAFYNSLSEARWFVWQGRSRQSENDDIADAREIPLYRLSDTGALLLNPGNGRIKPLVPRRFYHRGHLRHPASPETD